MCSLNARLSRFCFLTLFAEFRLYQMRAACNQDARLVSAFDAVVVRFGVGRR